MSRFRVSFVIQTEMDLKRFKTEVLPLRNKLLGYARKLAGNSDDAEDAVQEAMLRLWNSRDTLDQCRNIEAFATTVIHNVCMDARRTNHKADQPDGLPQMADDTASPHRLLELKDQVTLMKRIVDSLPSLQQTIMRMKDIDGYETEEIAQITGCNAEAIRSNLSRARKKVRGIYLKLTKERRME